MSIKKTVVDLKHQGRIFSYILHTKKYLLLWSMIFFRKILFTFFICLIFLSKLAFSSNWKREDNVECSIKTNHPELLESKPRCTSWSTNYQYQEAFFLKTNELIFYSGLQLAQPGYYWYNRWSYCCR